MVVTGSPSSTLPSATLPSGKRNVSAESVSSQRTAICWSSPSCLPFSSRPLSPITWKRRFSSTPNGSSSTAWRCSSAIPFTGATLIQAIRPAMPQVLQARIWSSDRTVRRPGKDGRDAAEDPALPAEAEPEEAGADRSERRRAGCGGDDAAQAASARTTRSRPRTEPSPDRTCPGTVPGTRPKGPVRCPGAPARRPLRGPLHRSPDRSAAGVDAAADLQVGRLGARPCRRAAATSR